MKDLSLPILQESVVCKSSSVISSITGKLYQLRTMEIRLVSLNRTLTLIVYHLIGFFWIDQHVTECTKKTSIRSVNLQQNSGGSRISRRGAWTSQGGCGLPRRLRFGNFVCQNERIGTLRRGVRRAPPQMCKCKSTARNTKSSYCTVVIWFVPMAFILQNKQKPKLKEKHCY